MAASTVNRVGLASSCPVWAGAGRAAKAIARTAGNTDRNNMLQFSIGVREGVGIGVGGLGPGIGERQRAACVGAGTGVGGGGWGGTKPLGGGVWGWGVGDGAAGAGGEGWGCCGGTKPISPA